MSAFEGKADIFPHRRMSAYEPKPTVVGGLTTSA